MRYNEVGKCVISRPKTKKDKKQPVKDRQKDVKHYEY